MAYTLIIVTSIAIFVIINRNESCDIPAKIWLATMMGGYLADFILQMSQLHYLKKHRKESLMIMALRFLVLSFIVGWLIYGNILYYKKSNPKECGTGLRLIMFLVLILGYFEMLKCCCIGMIVCIMVPFLFFAVRRAQRPNWIPAAPQFMQNLYKTKFNPE